MSASNCSSDSQIPLQNDVLTGLSEVTAQRSLKIHFPQNYDLQEFFTEINKRLGSEPKKWKTMEKKSDACVECVDAMITGRTA